MKNFWKISLLGLGALALQTGIASAWCPWPFSCCKPCVQTVHCKQYNAFSPYCCDTAVTKSCFGCVKNAQPITPYMPGNGCGNGGCVNGMCQGGWDGAQGMAGGEFVISETIKEDKKDGDKSEKKDPTGKASTATPPAPMQPNLIQPNQIVPNYGRPAGVSYGNGYPGYYMTGYPAQNPYAQPQYPAGYGMVPPQYGYGQVPQQFANPYGQTQQFANPYGYGAYPQYPQYPMNGYPQAGMMGR